MKHILIACLVVLTGCSTTVPVIAKFPEAPPILLESCSDLQKLEHDSKLSDVALVVNSNYSNYYACSSKHSAFIEWYTTNKKIFEDVK